MYNYLNTQRWVRYFTLLVTLGVIAYTIWFSYSCHPIRALEVKYGTEYSLVYKCAW